MRTGLLRAGLRINFNQRAPLAGFITPCVAAWDRSGLIQHRPHQANRAGFHFQWRSLGPQGVKRQTAVSVLKRILPVLQTPGVTLLLFGLFLLCL